MEKHRRRVKWTYWSLLALFAAGTGFIMSNYTNYLRAAGLNELTINLINISYFVSVFLFEIPTGLFADHFGRKKSFLVSCFLLSLSMAIYGMSTTPLGFILGEVTGAIAATFSSGAIQAWFVDELDLQEHERKDGKLAKMFTGENLARQIALIASCVIGGLLADHVSIKAPWFAGAITLAIAGIAASLIMKETKYLPRKFVTIKQSFSDMKETMIQSISFIRASKPFRFVVMSNSILYLSVMSANMGWQKFFDRGHSTNSWNSFLMIGVLASLAVGSLFASRLLRKIKNEQLALITSQVFIGICLTLTVIASRSYSLAVIFFILHEFGRGLYSPIKAGYIHNNIESDKRATLGSFESMANHFSGVFGLLMTGLVANTYGYGVAWIISGLILVISGPLLLFNKKS